MTDYHCECGQVLHLPEGKRGSNGPLTMHLRCASHTHRQQILALLRNPDTNLLDIRRQLNVSYAVVRRLADEIGLPSGYQRRFDANTERKLKNWWATAGQRPVVKKLVELGFKVEPIESFKPHLRFPHRVFMVNGYRVSAAIFCMMRRKLPGGPVFELKPQSQYDVDFQIGHAGGYFYVFPKSALRGLHKTSFTFEQTRETSHLAKKNKHHYRDYYEAWHLLKRPRGSKTKQSPRH